MAVRLAPVTIGRVTYFRTTEGGRTPYYLDADPEDRQPEDDDDGRGEPPPDVQAADPAELLALARRVVEKAMQQAPATRAKVRRWPLGQPSRSTRDGFRPELARHVERAVLVEVFNLPVKTVAAAAGVTLSTAYASIDVGRRLLMEMRTSKAPTTAATHTG